MSLYQKQKGLSETFTTFFKIANAKNTGSMVYVKSTEGKSYTHFINEKYGGWEDFLKPGNIMSVFVRKVEKEGKEYLNIYPNITAPKPLLEEDI